MTEPYEPWQPVKGQRVRIHPSPECRAELIYSRFDTLEEDDDAEERGEDTYIDALGHSRYEQGVVGTVVWVDHDPNPGGFDPATHAHRYQVEYDEQLAVPDIVGAGRQWNGFYAAIEISPLDPS